MSARITTNENEHNYQADLVEKLRAGSLCKYRTLIIKDLLSNRVGYSLLMPRVEYNLLDEKELPTHRDLHLDQSMDQKCDLLNTKPIVAAVTIEMFSLTI